MPNVLLPAPHVNKVVTDIVCQLVYKWFWLTRTETSLAKFLGTKEYGTTIRYADRLVQDGFTLQIRGLSRHELELFLSEGLPLIVRIWTAMLDYWHTITSDVVVVVGFDDTFVFLNDPAFARAPERVL